MLYAALGIIAFLVLVAILWPKGTGTGAVAPPSLDTSKSQMPAEPVANDSQHALKVEIAQRLDQIAAEPGGLMRFDTNGDGVLESQEMKAARVEIGLEIAKEQAVLPESSGVATPVEDELADVKPILMDD